MMRAPFKPRLIDLREIEFWIIISHVDQAALERGENDAAVQPVQKVLTSLNSEADLRSFEEILARKLFDLDCFLYARNVAESGRSTDKFLYMRLYVVARGFEFYKAVHADPAKMPNSISQECEALLHVHKLAWAELNGKAASQWPFHPSVSYKTYSNEDGWPTLVPSSWVV